MGKIKSLLLAMLVLVLGTLLKAQSEMTMEQMIPVRVMMPVNKEIKGDALTVLYNRVNQAVTLNGLGSSTNESRFLIVTSVTVLSKMRRHLFRHSLWLKWKLPFILLTTLIK